MKKLIIVILLIFPVALLANKGDWYNVHSHKTIRYDSKKSAKNTKTKPIKVSKKVKNLQRKWGTFKHR